MTRGNYLSPDSHSIFHTMKHQHEELFSMWKIERLIFLHYTATTTKNYTSGRKLCDMIEDDAEIFSNNFHCAALFCCDFSSWKFCRNFALNDVKEKSSLLPYQHWRLRYVENKFHIKWHSKYLSLAHAPPPGSMRGERKFHISRKYNGDK